MATTTITALTAGTALAGTEVSPFDQSGATVKITSAQLKTWTSASPTLVTPVLGVATATSINKVALTAPATGSTLTIADGVTLTVSANTTLSGTPATPALVRLAQVVTSGSQSTISFSTISGSYTNLKIVVIGRDTAASGDLQVRLKINGDGTSGNYTSSQYLLGNASSTGAGTEAASAAGSIIFNMGGTANNAAAMGSAEIIIPNYALTTFQKVVYSTTASYGSVSSGYTACFQRMFVWKSTAAITDLLLTAGGTAFVDGSVATLYGMT